MKCPMQKPEVVFRTPKGKVEWVDCIQGKCAWWDKLGERCLWQTMEAQLDGIRTALFDLVGSMLKGG